MDYTLENLVKLIRRRLKDEEYDEDDLKSFITLAQAEILGEDKYPFMQRSEEYSATGQGELGLPFDYDATFQILVRKGEETSWTPLHYVAPTEYFANAGGYCYTTFDNTVYYRINGQDDNFTVKHLYLAHPMPLTKDTDRTCIPPEYIEALLLGVLYRAEQQRDNFDYAQIYQNQQDQILTNMKMRYGQGNLSVENRAKVNFGGAYGSN